MEKELRSMKRFKKAEPYGSAYLFTTFLFLESITKI